MQLKIGIVRDAVVQHCHSGEPRKVSLPGEHIRLELDSNEFATLTERERVRLTKRWPRAYEVRKNNSALFYFPPKARFRFLTTYKELSVQQFQSYMSFTSSVENTLTGEDAFKLIELFYQEATNRLKELSMWRFDSGKEYVVSIKCFNHGYHLKITMPEHLFVQLGQDRSCLMAALSRLKVLDPKVWILRQ